MDKGPAAPEFLVIGRVISPHGMRGEVKVRAITDLPERFAPGKIVQLNGQPLKVTSSRLQKQCLVIKLETIDTIQDAERLRGRDITIPRSELRPLAPDEYHLFQIIGLNVLTTRGEALGRIVDVMTTASNDVYIVVGERGETLIPAIDDVIKYIDIDKGEMVIEAIEGLLGSK